MDRYQFRIFSEMHGLAETVAGRRPYAGPLELPPDPEAKLWAERALKDIQSWMRLAKWPGDIVVAEMRLGLCRRHDALLDRWMREAGMQARDGSGQEG